MPINRKYGWAPDLPDHRDHLYSAPQLILAKLPLNERSSVRVSSRLRPRAISRQLHRQCHLRGRSTRSEKASSHNIHALSTSSFITTSEIWSIPSIPTRARRFAMA